MNDDKEPIESPYGTTTALQRIVTRLKESETRYQINTATAEKSDVYFRAIIQNATDIIVIVDKIANITYVSPSIERFLGYKPEELIGRCGFNFVVPDDVPRALQIFCQAILIKDTVIPNAFGIRHKDGSIRFLEGVGTNLLDDPTVAGFVMNVRDVTERIKAEEDLAVYRERLEELVNERTSELAAINAQLRVELAERKRIETALLQSEERFRALIQKSSDVISILDEKGGFVYVSPSAETVFGYSPESLVGKSPFAFIHADDRDHARLRYQAVLDRVHVGESTEFRFFRGDGIWRILEAQGNNLLDYPGINGIVVTCRDVSERKESEKEHKQLTERLHRAEKMELLGTLAGGVAHDLNNVLGVLVGYSELLLLSMPGDSPLKKHVRSILNSSEKAAAIIQDLLTLARRGVAVSEVVNLNEVIADYLASPEFEKLQLYHPHVTIKSRLRKNLPNMKGSPVHLGKTIMNLVSNATEAISAKGLVNIRTTGRYLDKPVRGYDEVREGDYVILTISDNGEGISAEDQEKIFEPFYTKKTMGRSGTGLGLAVVWGTVKDHGGYIDVQSERGKGTTFTVYFPATREKLLSEQKQLSSNEYIGQGESILIVDDVREQREMLSNMLASLGYVIEAVSSGEEAVAYVKDRPVELLVLDMIMDPGIDGLETYEQILAVNPQQKAIVVSGFSETARVKKALKLGVAAYVRKPYLLEKIGVAVRDALMRPSSSD